MNKSRAHKILVSTGVFCSIVSLVALLLSLALPGVGWIITAANLVAASLVAPFIKKIFITIVFIVSNVHLFTLGPLSLLAGQGQGRIPTFFLILYVITPNLIALISIFISISFSNKRHHSN